MVLLIKFWQRVNVAMENYLDNKLMHSNRPKLDKSITYRGIAIFGPPSSGKSTVAQALHSALEDSILIEASKHLIAPLLNKTTLPDRIDQLLPLPTLAGSHVSEEFGRTEIERIKARTLFEALSRKYGADWVASVLLGWSKYTSEFQLTIISGARGYENALSLLRNRYIIVYLATPSAKILSRRSATENLNEAQILNDIALQVIPKPF